VRRGVPTAVAFTAASAAAAAVALAAAGCPGAGGHKGGAGAPGAVSWRSFTDTQQLGTLLVTPTHAWAGSDRGLLRWDLLTGEAMILSEDDGLASEPVRAIATEPSGAVWVAGDKGLSRIEGARITNFVGDAYPIDGRVTGLAVTVVGREPLHGWVATDKGLWRLAYGAWNLYSRDYKVNDLSAGLAGELWIATTDRGIVRLRADTTTAVGPAEGLPGATVTDLEVSADGQAVALCAAAPGRAATALAVFDGRSWRGFKPAAGGTLDLLARPEARGVVRFAGVLYEIVPLAGDADVAAMTAAEKAVPAPPAGAPGTWLELGLVSGSAAGDSPAPRGYALRSLGPPPGGARPTTVTLDHGGAVYVGTQNLGLARMPFAGGAATWFRTRDLVSGGHVLSLATDDAGRVYVPTRGRSVMVFDGASWSESVVDADPSAVVDAVVNDAAGAVWALHRPAGTNILKFSRLAADGKSWEPVGDLPISVPRGTLEVGYVAVTPTGRFWIAVSYRDGAEALPFGMAVTSPKLDEVSYYHRYDKAPPDPALNLPVNDISALTFDAGGAWMATFSGVFRLGKESSTLYTENEGLASEITYDVVRTRTGDTYVATGSGVGRLDGTSWTFDAKTGGIPRKAFRALAVDEAGTLWAGGSGGVWRKRNGDKAWERVDPKTTGLLDPEVLDIVVDRKGRLWFLTATGISLYEEK
jgi:ligand-binding sensor domain-containing protein